MKKITKSLLLAFLIGSIQISCLFAQNEADIKSNLKEHVSFLASSDLQGRYPASAGDVAARNYILEKMKLYGLKPVNGNWSMEFPVPTGVTPSAESAISFNTLLPRPGLPKDKWRKVEKKWTFGQEWSPLPFSGDGEISTNLVFVGYGISAPELNYDDYAGVDVKGKVVISLSNSPDKEKKGGPFDPFASMEYKAKNAEKHGAAGLLLIKVKGDSASVYEPLTNISVPKKSGIVCIQVNRDEVAKFFPRNKEYQIVPMELKIDKTLQPVSFELPDVSINLKLQMTDKTEMTANIFGMVEGNDPALKDQFIVVCANHDHLGKKEKSIRRIFYKPQVMNGADDNASGCAGVLELARMTAANPLPRPVIFAFFGGKEAGLTGSNAFIAKPPVPLANINSIINMNIIGRLDDDKLSIYGINSSGLLTSIVDTLAVDTDLNIIGAVNGDLSSDHEAFYNSGIPFLMLSSGLHEDIKEPDDIERKIRYKGMEKIVETADYLLKKIASNNSKPDCKSGINIYSDLAYTMPGNGAFIGIEEEMDDEDGILISGFERKSPAAKKVKKGDIIKTVNGTEVNNRYDIEFMIREMNPGDTITIEYERDGETNSTEIKLGKK